MLIKILCFVSLCLGAEPVKSALKAPSENYISHEGEDLTPKLDLDELDIGEVYQIGLYLEDLELHENYDTFMTKCHPFEEISKEQSWELRYYILTSWAAEQRLECTDHHGFFPILSTESIENVYIPLAQLLKQGFRKDTPSYSCLWDICLTSLQEYLGIMVHDGNPYVPKQQKKQYHKDRYPYKKEVLATVAELEEELSVKAGTDDTVLAVKFNDEIKIREIAPNRSINYFLRTLIETGNIINRFCWDVLRANPNLLDGYATTKECLYDLHAKYGILYDFVFDSEYQVQILFMGLSMEVIRPQFDQVWEAYKDCIEDWDQQQIQATLYPELFKALTPQSKESDGSVYSKDLSGHKLVRTTSYSGDLAFLTGQDQPDFPPSSSDALQLLISASSESARQRAASSRRRSLEIPLISVNGQLLDLDRKEADH